MSDRARRLRRVSPRPTPELWSCWGVVRHSLSQNLDSLCIPSDTIDGLQSGDIPDARIEFLGNLATVDACRAVAKARVLLGAFLELVNSAGKVLGDLRTTRALFDPAELELMEVLRGESCFDMQALGLSQLEQALLVAIATENLEYDWPIDAQNWRRNLSVANNLGEFFTPHEVISAILGSTVPRFTSAPARVVIMDPFAGVGSFLHLAYHRLRRLLGSDVDCTCVAIEKNPLFRAICADLLGSLTESTTHIVTMQGDSLLLRTSGTEVMLGSEQPDGFLGTASVVVTNPPFSRMKFHSSEFRLKESYWGDPSRSDVDTYIGARKRQLAEYKEALREFPELTPAMQGEWDLYQLGLMRSLSFLGPRGALGIITPSSILGDIRCSELRLHLLENYAISQIRIIDENVKVFPTVNQPVAFFTVRRTSKRTTSFCGRAKTRASLLARRQCYTLPNSEIVENFGPPYSIPLCDPALFQCYRDLMRLPKLREQLPGRVRRGELDLTAHARFVSADGNDPPLIRGDNIERFSVRPAHEHRKASHVRAEMFPGEVRPDLIHLVSCRRLVGRQCSYIRKKRRLSWAVIEPPAVVANSCNYILEEDGSIPLETLEVLLNSCLVDWVFRTTSTNNHVGNYEVERLPIPRLARNQMDRLVSYSEQLRDTYRTLPFGQSAAAAAQPEKAMDRYVLRLYGVTGPAAQGILDLYHTP